MSGDIYHTPETKYEKTILIKTGLYHQGGKNEDQKALVKSPNSGLDFFESQQFHNYLYKTPCTNELNTLGGETSPVLTQKKYE